MQTFFYKYFFRTNAIFCMNFPEIGWMLFVIS